MDKKKLNKFKKFLLAEKQRIMNNAFKNLEELKVDENDLPDENDLAATEVNQTLAFKLRDRERLLLGKVDQALAKIEEGTFGICEDCEEPIEVRRLEARPVSGLCLGCKERQEHREKVFA